MEFQEIIALIEKVSQSSLSSFSLIQDQNGIQIKMKKAGEGTEQTEDIKRFYQQEKEENALERIKEENSQNKEEEAEKEPTVKEQEFLSPMEGTFFYMEGNRALLRIGKELNDENGMEIGTIKDKEENVYNLSVRCLGEVTQICVSDGQQVEKGQCLFFAKVEKGNTKVDIL